jgi:hypothetical protein
MWLKGLPSLHVVDRGFSTAPGVKAADQAETSLRLSRAGTGNIPGNSGAPIPVDPCPLFESGEITIDRMFHGFLSSNVVPTLSGSVVLFCAQRFRRAIRIGTVWGRLLLVRLVCFSCFETQ